MKLDLVWLADRLYAPAAFRDGGVTGGATAT